MKKLVVINEFENRVISNEYDDIINVNITDISNMGMEPLKNLLLEIYDYIFENSVDDVVFMAKNERYCYLTELFYIIRGIKNGGERGTFSIYIVPEKYLKRLQKENLIIEDIMMKIDILRPRLTEFQVHLNDNCNLNCKGCGHFCPIVHEANFLKLEEYDRDLSQINQKFWGVGKIYLLGGEPLLHPQVSEFAVITRRHFPDADIRLYTNGLLLNKQDGRFWRIIRENSIHIEISLYTPTLDMFDKIETVLKDNGVWEDAILWENKQQFSKGVLLQNNGNKEKVYEKCTSKICHFLRNGYLALCPSIFLRKYFWDYYDIEPQYKPEANAINLYDENITGRDILEYLHKPNEACCFCGTEEYFDWDTRTGNTAQIADWVVDNLEK